jgi:hypothetical protein
MAVPTSPTQEVAGYALGVVVASVKNRWRSELTGQRSRGAAVRRPATRHSAYSGSGKGDGSARIVEASGGFRPAGQNGSEAAKARTRAVGAGA